MIQKIRMVFQTVAIIAKGTWGDVYPLLSVGIDVAMRDVNIRIILITHYSHEERINSELIDHRNLFSNEKISAQFECAFLDTPAISLGITLDEQDSFHDLSNHIPVYLWLISTAVLSLKLIVFNLFAMEGWLIAMRMDIPCVIVHPHVPLSQCPASLWQNIYEESLPLYHHIFGQSQQLQTQSQVQSEQHNSVINAEVDINRSENETENENEVTRQWTTYLWPILSSHYDNLRSSLGLASPLSMLTPSSLPVSESMSLSLEAVSDIVHKQLRNRPKKLFFCFSPLFSSALTAMVPPSSFSSSFSPSLSLSLSSWIPASVSVCGHIDRVSCSLSPPPLSPPSSPLLSSSSSSSSSTASSRTWSLSPEAIALEEFIVSQKNIKRNTYAYTDCGSDSKIYTNNMYNASSDVVDMKQHLEEYEMNDVKRSCLNIAVRKDGDREREIERGEERKKRVKERV